jgi:hypothetical protein
MCVCVCGVEYFNQSCLKKKVFQKRKFKYANTTIKFKKKSVSFVFNKEEKVFLGYFWNFIFFLYK